MNILGLNQLFIEDQLIEQSKRVNKLLDEEINKLVNIREKLEENYQLSDEDFFKVYENNMSEINIQSFVKEIEHYLEKVKSEFYKEYNVDRQKDYVHR